jgi:GNAT superfamily N-acetyltransferase
VTGPAVGGPAMSAGEEPRARERVRVRDATADDVPAVAAAVRELLIELGGTPPAAVVMEAAARTAITDPEAGAVVVAAPDGGPLVGVLAASWPLAIHAGGVYGLIQDLWVDRAWRSAGVGAELIEAYCDLAARRGADRVEVGIPRDSFPALEATRRFYERCGFDVVGARMRRRTA